MVTLINRKQAAGQHFEQLPGGAANLTDEGRRDVVVAYQKGKSEEVRHLLFDRMVLVRLLPRARPVAGPTPSRRPGVLCALYRSVELEC